MELILGILDFTNKKMIIYQLMVILCLSLSGCTDVSNSIEPEGQAYQEEKNLNDVVVDEEAQNVTDNYKIYQGTGEKDFWYFYYDLYDSEGNIVKHQCTYMDQPLIENVFSDILKISVQAGTGLETRWTYYYDTRNNAFSPTYYYVLNENEKFVAYYETGSVVVCSMFEENYVKKINIPTKLKNIENPVDEVSFSEDLKSLQIIYVDGSGVTVKL